MLWKITAWTFPTETILYLILISAILYFWFREKNLKTPPGPWSIPILGCNPFILRDFSSVAIAKLAQTYGKISSLQIGSKRVIFLNDYQTIKEAIVKSKEFDAHSQPFVKIMRLSNTVFASRNDETTSLRRAFLISVKSGTEVAITDELNCLFNEFRKFGEQFFDPSPLILMFTNNFTTYVMYGHRYDYSSDTMKKIISIVREISRQIAQESKLLFFPWVYQIPIIGPQLRNDPLQQQEHYLSKMVLEKLGEVRQGYIDNSRHHFTDSFLTERQSQIDRTGNEGYFTDDKLISNLVAAFKLGADTTGTALLWILFFVGKHPRVYKKLKQEIQDVLGTERGPNFSDQQKMPYIQAIIMETHRFGGLTPLTAFRCNDNSTQINGYIIPKDSLVTLNLWAVHNDPNLWTDPDVFRPERFIDDDGQILKSEYLIPFSVGKRRCPAEATAQSMIFLFVASIYQKFRIETRENFGGKIQEALTIKPPPFEIRLIPD